MNAEALLKILVAENAKRRESRKWLLVTFAVGGALLLFLKVFAAIRNGESPDFGSLMPLLALCGAGAAFSTQHRKALTDMSQLATRESAGFLVEALVTTDEKDVREVCVAGLLKALPLVENANDFDDYQRGLFYRLFSTAYSPDLVAVALESAKKVSGAEGISALEKFYRTANANKDPIWQRLGNRAQQILPDIRIREARRIIEARLGETGAAFDREATRADESIHTQ